MQNGGLALFVVTKSPNKNPPNEPRKQAASLNAKLGVIINMFNSPVIWSFRAPWEKKWEGGGFLRDSRMRYALRELFNGRPVFRMCVTLHPYDLRVFN